MIVEVKAAVSILQLKKNNELNNSIHLLTAPSGLNDIRADYLGDRKMKSQEGSAVFVEW